MGMKEDIADCEEGGERLHEPSQMREVVKEGKYSETQRNDCDHNELYELAARVREKLPVKD